MTAAATTPAPRDDNIRLGILYMMGAVFLFSIRNAIGKWLAQSYPMPMLVFFRSFVALLPAHIIVMRAGGPRIEQAYRWIPAFAGTTPERAYRLLRGLRHLFDVGRIF